MLTKWVAISARLAAATPTVRPIVGRSSSRMKATAARSDAHCAALYDRGSWEKYTAICDTESSRAAARLVPVSVNRRASR
jgi:hypothetical protein